MQIKQELIKANSDRVNWGKQRSLSALIQLAERVCTQPMAMICQPPPPDRAFLYGDLVPLGFLLRSLNASPLPSSTEIELRTALENYLLRARQGQLWALKRDRLITCTDSVLVLQGLLKSDLHFKASVAALEIFADGKGGYYPQLWSQEQQPGKMLYHDSVRHCCQPDYATTCLVRWLQLEIASVQTTTDYLFAGFEHRSGLSFANPYMVDWALAMAISQDDSAKDLRLKLCQEILASINPDYSFGMYDVALSTALAILSLAALGDRSRTIRLAQLKLIELMQPQGTFPKAIPFYSSLSTDDSNDLMQMSFSEYFIQVKGKNYAISYYIDKHSMITTSLAHLALSETSLPEKVSPDLDPIKDTQSHPRYHCRSHGEYIAKFALPPYV